MSKISLVWFGVASPWVIEDELWERIEPLLPPWPMKAPGPRPMPDRLCLQGVLFVLFTSIGWEDLPQELGFGSGMTCWRRLRRWSRIDWSRAAMDGSHIDTKKGGAGTGPWPVNHAKPGSKHHPICDGNGTPMRVLTTGANVPDISKAIDLLDAVPPVAGRRGRLRRRFPVLLAH